MIALFVSRAAGYGAFAVSIENPGELETRERSPLAEPCPRGLAVMNHRCHHAHDHSGIGMVNGNSAGHRDRGTSEVVV
jgi:hypothetical protein